MFYYLYKMGFIVTSRKFSKKAIQKLFYKIPTSGVEKPDFQMGFENLEILRFFEFHEKLLITL